MPIIFVYTFFAMVCQKLLSNTCDKDTYEEKEIYLRV